MHNRILTKVDLGMRMTYG